MKNSPSRRALAAWLCTLMLLPSAVSCGESKSDGSKQPDKPETNADQSTVVTEPADPNTAALQQAIDHLPDVDFEGASYTILCRDEKKGGWATIDVYSEEETGDAINDAVYKRNHLL